MDYGERIKRLEVLISRLVNERLQPFGLTMQQQSVLRIVYARQQAGSPASQRDIEEALEISNPTVTGLCSRLEAKGLIRRERDRNDARTWRIFTTQADSRLREELMTHISKIEEELTNGMSKAEKEQLSRLLEQMEQNLAAMEAKKQEG